MGRPKLGLSQRVTCVTSPLTAKWLNLLAPGIENLKSGTLFVTVRIFGAVLGLPW